MRPALWPLMAALALAACHREGPAALQGYVEGEYVRVAAPFAGTLVALDVQRGQQVAAGDALFALEAANEQAARREAEAGVRRAEAQLEDLRKGKRATEIESARAQLAQAEDAAALSAKEYARQLDLVARGFVSRQAADAAKSARDRDHNRVVELQNTLATTRAGARPDELRAAMAQAAAAREALAQADWRLRQKSVAASVGGAVDDTLFALGEWVPAGAPVVSLLPPGNVKVRFFVPETRLASVKIGQAVALSCDGCGPGLAATVSFIAPRAEFTPPFIYSKENRAKLVFLVEARPPPRLAPSLHPGQPVDVVLQ
jgi:HlyD family secretion protein